MKISLAFDKNKIRFLIAINFKGKRKKHRKREERESERESKLKHGYLSLLGVGKGYINNCSLRLLNIH